MSEWISVNDRLPERYTEVLVWPRPNDQLMTAEFGLHGRDSKPCWFYGEYESSWGWTTYECDVTHWMPIPQPPEES